MRRPKRRRILGMTFTQWLVLGFLAVVAIVTVLGGFYYINRPPTSGAVSIPPSGQPAPGALPALTPNLAEITAQAFSPAPIPPEWRAYSTSRLEVRVPPQFVPMDVNTRRQESIAFFRAQGFNTLATQLENDPLEYRFWLDFPRPDSTGFDTSITVKEDILPTLTLDDYVDQVYGAGLQGFTLIDRREIPIGGGSFQARRVLMTANFNNQGIGVVDYIITDEVNLWIIRCWTDFLEYDFWLPAFDQVASSFRLAY